MPTKKLTPARLAAHRFGSGRKLSKLLGGSPYRVGQWIARGGDIPNGDGTHRKLLALAKQEGVKLTPGEIINGGYANA